MALLKASFTPAKLAQLFSESVAQEAVDDAAIRARFGAPLRVSTQRRQGLAAGGDERVPYPFLAPDGILSYNELGHAPHYTDARGRQLFAVGRSAPTLVYVRIPKGITREENAKRVPLADRLDIPQVGEELVLTRAAGFGRRGSAEREGPEVRVTVLARLGQKVATALLQVSDEVRAPEGLDIGEDAQPFELPSEEERAARERLLDRAERRLERLEASAEARARELREHGYSFDADQESRARPAPQQRAPRSSSGARMPPMRAPRAPQPRVKKL